MKEDSSPQLGEPPRSSPPPPALDEARLRAVRQLRAGVQVEESFRTLHAWLSPRLLGYFRAHRFSHADAEDLVQKTLARVYQGIRQLEREEKFLPWLFAIARNVRSTAAERERRERRLWAGDLEEAKELPDPKPATWFDDARLAAARLKRLHSAIEALPPQQRQCLLLRVRDELSYEEIAETLHLSANTVRNHLAEAKKRLQKALKKEPEGAAGL
jgi:RNA polymerase sigma-70 factor, ECF subfamily